jgi:FixJ family two-component response regulator
MSTPQPVVHAVDDDPSVLRGLERLLRSAGYQARIYSSAEPFLAEHDPESLGCLILDLAMPGCDGIQVQQRMVASGSVLPIIFLTGRGDVPTTVRAMKNGAADFHTKPVDDRELLAAVERAIERCRSDLAERRERADCLARLASLTAREREVFEHLLGGERNKQIAGALGTVEKTVKVHRARILHKLRASSVAELVRLAERAKAPRKP